MVSCTVAFVVAIVGWRWAGSEREDLAQWVMAGAAVATLIAAVGAAVFAASAFGLESERESRFQDGQRRQQAERIAAWFTTEDAPVTGRKGEVYFYQESHVVHLRNASDLPVTGVDVLVAIEGTLVVRIQRDVLPPAEEPIDIYLDADQAQQMAGAWQSLGTTKEHCPPKVDLGFVDTAGQRWLREHGGRLTHIS